MSQQREDTEASEAVSYAATSTAGGSTHAGGESRALRQYIESRDDIDALLADRGLTEAELVVLGAWAELGRFGPGGADGAHGDRGVWEFINLNYSRRLACDGVREWSEAAAAIVDDGLEDEICEAAWAADMVWNAALTHSEVRAGRLTASEDGSHPRGDWNAGGAQSPVAQLLAAADGLNPWDGERQFTTRTDASRAVALWLAADPLRGEGVGLLAYGDAVGLGPHCGSSPPDAETLADALLVVYGGCPPAPEPGECIAAHAFHPPTRTARRAMAPPQPWPRYYGGDGEQLGPVNRPPSEMGDPSGHPAETGDEPEQHQHPDLFDHVDEEHRDSQDGEHPEPPDDLSTDPSPMCRSIGEAQTVEHDRLKGLHDEAYGQWYLRLLAAFAEWLAADQEREEGEERGPFTFEEPPPNTCGNYRSYMPDAPFSFFCDWQIPVFAWRGCWGRHEGWTLSVPEGASWTTGCRNHGVQPARDEHPADEADGWPQRHCAYVLYEVGTRWATAGRYWGSEQYGESEPWPTSNSRDGVTVEFPMICSDYDQDDPEGLFPDEPTPAPPGVIMAAIHGRLHEVGHLDDERRHNAYLALAAIDAYNGERGDPESPHGGYELWNPGLDAGEDAVYGAVGPTGSDECPNRLFQAVGLRSPDGGPSRGGTCTPGRRMLAYRAARWGYLFVDDAYAYAVTANWATGSTASCPVIPWGATVDIAASETVELVLPRGRGNDGEQWVTVHPCIAERLTLLTHAADDERTGVDLGTYGALRTVEQQQRLREAHGCPDRRLPATACRPPTAPPGKSLHNIGLAVDFSGCSVRTSQCYAWMLAHGPNFGFYATVPGEPWHWAAYEARPCWSAAVPTPPNACRRT